MESVVAPSRLVENAVSKRDSHPESSIFAECGPDGIPAFQAICLAAEAGDALARTVLAEAAGHFAVAINNIVQICDPGRIVLFGDYVSAGDFFLERLVQAAQTVSLIGIDKRTVIEYSHLSEDQGVVGAANMMTDSMFAGGK